MSNPHNVWQSLAWLDQQTVLTAEDWTNECDGLQARAYGWAHSGEPTALDHWQSIPFKYRFQSASDVQPGDLAFWGGGAGHVVTLTSRNRANYTNDVLRWGRVDYCSWKRTNTRWGKPFLGYSRPVFPHGSGHNPLPPTVELWPPVKRTDLVRSKRTGTKQPGVLLVQRALHEYVGLRYESGPGIWGPRTQAAYERAQARCGRRNLLPVLRALSSRTSVKMVPMP